MNQILTNENVKPRGILPLLQRFFKHFKLDMLLPAVCISLLFVLGLPIFKNINVDSFDRQIGMGLINNKSIDKIISNFYTVLFVLFPILTAGFWFLLSTKKFSDNDSVKKSKKYLHSASLLCVITLSLNLLVKSTIEESLSLPIDLSLLFFMMLSLLTFTIIFSEKASIKSVNNFIFSVFISLSFIVSFAFFRYTAKHETSFASLDLGIIYFVACFTVYVLIEVLDRFFDNNAVIGAFIPLLLAPVLVSLMLEVLNILNQHEVYAVKKTLYSLLIYLVMFLCSASLLFVPKTKIRIKFSYKLNSILIPALIVLTFILLWAQPAFQITVSTDFFESANHGLGIYEFFKYGKIPILETFDAHMLENQLGGIVYGFLTKDIAGAVFNPYSAYNYLLYYGAFFVFLAFLFGCKKSALITLFLPLNIIDGFSYYVVGLILIPIAYKVIKTPNIKHIVLFWMLLVFTALFRLDIGYMYGIAVVLVLAVFFIDKLIKKQYADIKRFSLVSGIIIAAFLLLWIVLCLASKVHPVTRLLEFFSITSSNTNWAYGELGDTNNFAFGFFYVVMPLICVTVVFLLSYCFVTKKHEIDLKFYISSVILFLAYASNFSRGLVRHSLYENTYIYLAGTAVFFLCTSFAAFSKKDSLRNFVIAFVSLSIICSLTVSNANLNSTSLYSESMNKYTAFSEYETTNTKKKNRVVMSEIMLERQRYMSEVFDFFLEEGETYMSLQFESLYYFLADREKVVYVNQSPWLLSGEYSQIKFIEEIEDNKDRVSFALVSRYDLLDGVNSEVRYYLLYEYMYRNFTPVGTFKNMILLAKNDRLEGAKNKLATQPIEFVESNFTAYKESLHEPKSVYNLNWLPYIWANYDKIAITKKTEQLSIDAEKLNINMVTDFSNADIDKSEGNYLYLNISSEVNQDIQLRLYSSSSFDNHISLNFHVVAGVETPYLVRISPSYWWHNANLDKIAISNNSLTVNQIKILQGDTL